MRVDRACRAAVGVLVALGIAWAPGLATLRAASQESPAAGSWTGQINLPPGPLQLSVVLAQDSGTGAWSGTIDIPAQGAARVPLTGVSVDGRAVTFVIAGVPGEPTFAGTIATDGSTLTGTFSQGGASFPFELRRGTAAPLSRPQEPKPPFPYRAEEVRYRNELADIGLAGTLTLPPGAGPFPAVVLISGSGPQDRDSTLFGHKPFLLLADTLTRRGVAVLRVDDRGVGGSDRGSMEPTTADLADDVRAGVRYLESRSDIDGDRIGLIGHSEGGVVAPMVAATSPRIRFVVMLAGEGVRGDELMMQQVRALAAVQGVPQDVIDWDLAMRRRVYDVVMAEKDGTPNPAAREALIATIPPIPVPEAPRDAAEETVRRLLQATSSRWWRYFLSYDPAEALRRVRCPVLALIGGNDRQVPADGNLPVIRAALEANPDATVRELPGLNHLFQTSASGAPGDYALIEETMAPAALSLIADWVVARTR